MKSIHSFLSILTVVFIVNSYIFPIFFFLFLALGLVSFIISVYLNKNRISVEWIVIFIVIIIAIIPAAAYKYSDMANLKSIMLLLISIMFSYSLALLKPIKSKLLCWSPLMLTFITFTFFIFKGRIAEDFFPLNSANFVSITLFLGLASYYVLSKKFTVDIWVVSCSLVILMFCIYAIGRAGVALALVLFVFNSFFYFFEITDKMTKNAKFILRTIMIMSSIILFYFGLFMLYDMGLLERIVSRGFTDYSREVIISSYLNSLFDLKNLLFGVKLEHLEIMNKFGNNLHNSYLNVHSIYGMFYFILFLFLILYSFFRLNNKKYYAFSLLLLIICVRGITDIQVFAGRGDWVVFFCVFYLSSVGHKYDPLSQKYRVFFKSS